MKVKNWDTERYPFSVKPDHPLTLAEVMDLHRDAYEGTPVDRRNGEGAGLFASPYRYGDNKWERSITSRNIAYTWITQAKDTLPCPIFWLSMNAPAESVYIPLAVSPLPEAYEKADRKKYEGEKAWWISGQVTTLTRGYYSVLAPEVREAAKKEEQRAMELVGELWKPPSPIRALTVTAIHLSEEGEAYEQTDLFAPPPQRQERQEKLEGAMARIRQKYGSDAIVFGAARPEKEDPLP